MPQVEVALRILMLTRNLPPLRGGMERLNRHIALELARVAEMELIGPVGCKAYVAPIEEVAEVPVKPLWRFFLEMARASWRAAQRHPQQVFAGSGLSAPFAWLAARRSGSRTAVMLHGLDLVVPSRIYRALFLPAIRRCDRVLVNSRATRQLAESAGIDTSRIRVVNPGMSLVPTVSQERIQALCIDHGLGNRPLLLSVGRLTPRKGLLEFVERILPLIVARVPDALLLVIGGEAADALHGGRGGMATLIARGVEDQGLSAHVRLLGSCDDETLSSAFAAARVHVFPVRDRPGDIEGFGMVALEAAAHGLFTVAFDVGGVADAIADGVSGRLLAADDDAGFADAVIAACNDPDRAATQAACRDFAFPYRWEAFGKRLRAALDLPEPAV